LALIALITVCAASQTYADTLRSGDDVVTGVISCASASSRSPAATGSRRRRSGGWRPRRWAGCCD